MITVHLIAAARPNFMKIAPLYHALKKDAWFRPEIIYTGQHRDYAMSGQLMEQLGIAPCEYPNTPDVVVVPGDVRDSRGAALKYLANGVHIVHLEAGLRSGDTRMPEEINRIVIDHVSDLLWTPSHDATLNLQNENTRGVVECIGNIMIDAFEMLRPRIEAVRRSSEYPSGYAVATFHRPSNVDDPRTLAGIIDQLAEVARGRPVFFPVHPRTSKELEPWMQKVPRLYLLPPQPYIEFMALVMHAHVVITDSGGIQEETTHLGIPCLTVRENTERPITLTHGTNRLIAPNGIADAVWNVIRVPRPQIPYWDGHTAKRAVASLGRFMHR